MRRTLVIRSLGIVLAGVVVLSMGDRPPLQASPGPATFASAVVGGGFGGAKDEPVEPGRVVHLPARPMSPEATRVWMKLQDKLAMPFTTDTPLEDVIKYIQESTKDPVTFPEGIPFYVDPQGLQDSDKTMASTVTINLKGIPLATTLGLLLKQLNLDYQIHKDGMVMVISKDSEEFPENVDAMILDQISALRLEIQKLRDKITVSHIPSGQSGMYSGPLPMNPDYRPASGGGGMR